MRAVLLAAVLMLIGCEASRIGLPLRIDAEMGLDVVLEFARP